MRVGRLLSSSCKRGCTKVTLCSHLQYSDKHSSWHHLHKGWPWVPVLRLLPSGLSMQMTRVLWPTPQPPASTCCRRLETGWNGLRKFQVPVPLIGGFNWKAERSSSPHKWCFHPLHQGSGSFSGLECLGCQPPRLDLRSSLDYRTCWQRWTSQWTISDGNQFPWHIVPTYLRPGIVWWDSSSRSVCLAELTVCFETNFDDAADR